MALAKRNTRNISNAGVPIELFDPADQTRMGVRFFMLGADSDEFKKFQRKVEAARLEKQKKIRGVYMASPEETEENNLDLLTLMTKGWEEDVTDAEGKVVSVRSEIELEEGQLVAFSPEAARAIYKDPGYSFVREQIDAAIGDRRNFLPSESKN